MNAVHGLAGRDGARPAQFEGQVDLAVQFVIGQANAEVGGQRRGQALVEVARRWAAFCPSSSTACVSLFSSRAMLSIVARAFG